MEEEVTKTPKSKFFERLGKYDKFKDKEYPDEDPDMLFEDLDAFLEEQEGSLNEAEQFKTEMAETFRKYPEVYEFIQALVEAPENLSEDEVLAFALNTVFTEEEIQNIFNSDKDIVKGIREQKKMAASLKAEIEKNLNEFQPSLDKFADEYNIPEDKKEQFLTFLETEIPNMIAARFTPKLLKILYQAFIYEEEMSNLSEDKAIQAKNNEPTKEYKSLMPNLESNQSAKKSPKRENVLDLVIGLNKK